MQQDISDKWKLFKPWVLRNSGPCAIIWTLIIFVLCATPGQYIPSNDWLDLLSIDKLVHAGMFYILYSLCFLSAVKNHQTKLKLVYLFATIGYGGLLEIMQAFCFSNRSADWKDMIANTAGCVTAYVICSRSTT